MTTKVPSTMTTFAPINAKDFGATGNNVTDDTAAIQAACNFAQARGGGTVYLPPTGAPYRVAGTIALGNGVVLAGDACKNFAGVTATVAQWAASGSWLRPEHPTNPAVRCQGHGSGVQGINFIHNQPVPTGTFTPTQYGYCISQNISFSQLSDILIVNAWNGIEVAYTSGSGGGTNVLWNNILISAFNNRFRTSNVNDVMRINNLDCRNLYYASTPAVVAYIRANTIGWRCGYTDNIQAANLQFFEESAAIYLENETCLGITHSLYNAQLSNIQFSLCQKSVVLANSSVNSRAFLSNTLAQQGNAFGYTWADLMFNFAGDNIYWVFDGLRVVDAGGQIMSLGNGAGGKVLISNLEVENYSSVSAGQVGFGLAAGSELRLTGYRVNKTAGAGLRFSGAGIEGLRTDLYGGVPMLSRFGEVDFTSTGAGWVDWTADLDLRPGSGRHHLVRMNGNAQVFTAVAASTFSIRMSGVSGLTVTGLSSATTGFRFFDTGWVEVTEAELAALGTYGRLQINPSVAGIRILNGAINVAWK